MCVYMCVCVCVSSFYKALFCSSQPFSSYVELQMCTPKKMTSDTCKYGHVYIYLQNRIEKKKRTVKLLQFSGT